MSDVASLAMSQKSCICEHNLAAAAATHLITIIVVVRNCAPYSFPSRRKQCGVSPFHVQPGHWLHVDMIVRPLLLRI